MATTYISNTTSGPYLNLNSNTTGNLTWSSTNGSSISNSLGYITVDNAYYTIRSNIDSVIKSLLDHQLAETTLRSLINDPEIKDHIDWDSIIKNQTVSEKFLTDYYDKIDKDVLLQYKSNLSYKFLTDNYESLKDNKYLWSRQILTLDFLNEHYDDINWEYFSSNNNLANIDQSFYINNMDKLIINNLFTNISMTDETFNIILDKLDYDRYNEINFYRLSWCRELTEENIMKYIDNLDFESPLLSMNDRTYEDQRIVCYIKLKY